MLVPVTFFSNEHYFHDFQVVFISWLPHSEALWFLPFCFKLSCFLGVQAPGTLAKSPVYPWCLSLVCYEDPTNVLRKDMHIGVCLLATPPPCPCFLLPLFSYFIHWVSWEMIFFFIFDNAGFLFCYAFSFCF